MDRNDSTATIMVGNTQHMNSLNKMSVFEKGNKSQGEVNDMMQSEIYEERGTRFNLDQKHVQSVIPSNVTRGSIKVKIGSKETKSKS